MNRRPFLTLLLTAGLPVPAASHAPIPTLDQYLVEMDYRVGPWTFIEMTVPLWALSPRDAEHRAKRIIRDRFGPKAHVLFEKVKATRAVPDR